jgi:hypothetical protein
MHDIGVSKKTLMVAVVDDVGEAGFMSRMPRLQIESPLSRER